jgi:hypothetical protein
VDELFFPARFSATWTWTHKTDQLSLRIPSWTLVDMDRPTVSSSWTVSAGAFARKISYSSSLPRRPNK